MAEKKILWEECDWFNDDDDELGDDEDSGEFDDGYGEDSHQHQKIRIHKLINTPFGLATYSDKMSPIHDTQFVIAHLNFNLSAKRIDLIKKVDGVEFLQPLSRYRFIIGIGRMFDIIEVCEMVEEVLEIKHEPMAISKEAIQSQEIKDIIREIGEKQNGCEFWAAYVFPNGNYQFSPLDSEESVHKKKEEYMTWQRLSNGMILTSIE